MRIIKLEKKPGQSQRLVVSENGSSLVLTLPCGVSFNEESGRFNTWIINEDTKGWRNKSWSSKKHGAVTAFESAVEAREDSLDFLLNRRLLPRIRKEYEYREINGLIIVRDPLEKKNRYFSSLKAAVEFNTTITKQWIDTYLFDKASMIQHQNGKQFRRLALLDKGIFEEHYIKPVIANTMLQDISETRH
jgi:hypothetical protein